MNMVFKLSVFDRKSGSSTMNFVIHISMASSQTVEFVCLYEYVIWSRNSQTITQSDKSYVLGHRIDSRTHGSV